MSEIHYGRTSDGDTAMVLAAERLELDNPLWIVLYGVYTEEFIAFPRFNAPSGMTVLAARYPLALAERMREIERQVHGYLPRQVRASGLATTMRVEATEDGLGEAAAPAEHSLGDGAC